MLEWIKKNQEKVIYGLVILVIILLIVIFSTRSSTSREIDRLSRSISALEADLAAGEKTIGEEREKYDELTRNFDASKAEAAKQAEEITELTAVNRELSNGVKSLEEFLSDANLEIGRLDFVALLRENNIENLTNEVTVLKQVEVDLKAEAARQAEEISKLTDDNGKLSLNVRSLDTSLWGARTEINRLSRANSALEALASAKDKKIDEERGQFAELTLSYEAFLSDANLKIDRLDFVALLREKNIEDLTNEVAVLRQVEVDSKAEAEKLAAEIARLTLENTNANLEIDRLDFVALLREKNIEDLTNEVAVLRQVEVNSKEEAEKLTAEIARLTSDNMDANLHIGRLDFVALLREKNIEDLTNEVTVLRRVEAESKNEIVRLSNAKLALEAESAAKSNTIVEEREKLGELTRDYDAALAEANLEIERLEFVALLREKNIEDLTNEVTVLKQVEADSKAEAAKLAVEIARLTLANADLSGQVNFLDVSLTDAENKIGRLEKDILNLRNEAASLEPAEPAEVIAEPESEAEPTGERPVIPSSTESALPAVPDAADTMVMKLSDTSSLVTLTSVLQRIYAELSKFDLDIPVELTNGLEMFEEFAASTSEMSLLIAPSDNPVFYLSFFVDESAFGDFISKRQGINDSLCSFERWPGVPAGGTGWTMKFNDPFSEEDPVVAYIMKLSGDSGTMVLASNDAQGISEMTDAALETSPSFDIERRTAGDSYYQIKLRDGVKVRDIIENFVFDSDIRDMMEMMVGDPERVLWSVSECSWISEGETHSFESYSDIFQLNPEFASARQVTQETANIFGDGDLAYFLSADVGFIMRCLFLGAADPAELLFTIVGEVIAPMFSEGDLRKIIDSGVLSIACVADGSSLSTAYLLLESEAPEVVDRLFSMSYMMGGQHARIQGWENVLTWPIPIPGFPADIVLAKNDGALLIGLGNDKSLGMKLTPSDEHKPYLSREDVMSGIVSPKFFDVAINLMESVVIQGGGVMSDVDEHLYGTLTVLRDSFDLICARVSLTSNSDGKIILKEGGGLLEAYMKLLLSWWRY